MLNRKWLRLCAVLAIRSGLAEAEALKPVTINPATMARVNDRVGSPEPGKDAGLVAAGVKTAIASFSRAFGSLAPAGTAKWLRLDAAIAGGYGIKDLRVLGGDPLSVKTWVERVYVNGELVHQRKP